MSIFMDTSARRAKLLSEWRLWVPRIAKVVKEVIPDAEIYVVGSVVRGDSVGGSDVDILVASEYTPEKNMEIARLKAAIEDKLSLPYYHPFEIHILKPGEARYFIERSRGYVLRIA
ncbi:MAG: nucleotidyltransferase domain-containing protein [Sulfolobales archaeon]